MATFNGQLKVNEVIGALFNMIISQWVYADNIEGLDSSLVCSIAAKKSEAPIKTFAIGMSEDAIDLKYAKQAADYIGSDHKEIIITKDDVLSSLETVVHLLGTFDITTIRASMGMYLICKALQQNHRAGNKGRRLQRHHFHRRSQQRL